MRREASRHTLKEGTVVTIRSLSPGDGQAVVDFMQDVYTTSKYMVKYPDEWTITARAEAAYIRGALEDSQRILLGVFHKGYLVAMGDVFEVSKRSRLRHRGSLSLAVALPYEGRGIGSLLVKILIEEARKIGFEQVELTVVTQNKAAVHIYEKHGFLPYGTLKRGMKNRDGSYWDLLHMVKELSSVY